MDNMEQGPDGAKTVSEDSGDILSPESEMSRRQISDLDLTKDNVVEHMEDLKDLVKGEDGTNSKNVSKISHQIHKNDKHSTRMKSSNNGELSNKIFLSRESLLTELYKDKHICSVFNIFFATLIIIYSQYAVNDILTSGRLNLGLSLMLWNFSGFHIFFLIWILMFIGTVCIYYCFQYWAHGRTEYHDKSLTRKTWDCGWLMLFIVYQLSFVVWPVVQVWKYDLPPASSMAVLMEQVRLIMKTHAFVRSNAPKVLLYKPHSEQDKKGICPKFDHFLYFLFVPTLVYRNSYPRTSKISWGKVIWHFMEVVCVIFYMSFSFERFLKPLFFQYGTKNSSIEQIVVTIFASMMPGIFIFKFLGFFGLLHSWMNACAEITHFADRMFYKDWWNANSYAEFYRMWNTVVQDWLYTYIYKEYCLWLKPKTHFGAMFTVFMVSALVHEYILTVVFGFFYPVLLFSYAGLSVCFVTLWKPHKCSNIAVWLTLYVGIGINTAAYGMEWYARINCPQIHDDVWDFFIPRSWFCNTVY